MRSRIEAAGINPDLAAFAIQMITDHTKSTTMVKRAKAGELAPIPPVLKAKQKQDLADRGAARSTACDTLYALQQEAALVITDHLMPGMSGVQLTRALVILHPALPVLIISGFAEEEGIDADIPRLTKHFRSTDLASSLLALGSVMPSPQGTLPQDEASQIAGC